MNPTSFDFDVALSFAGEDRKIAEELADLLLERGVTVFYDKHIQAELWGKDLYQHLQFIYRDKAQYCIVFVSEAYAKKLWTRHELKQAQARAFRESREYILPLRLDDTELPGLNETVGYIDLRTTDLVTVRDLVLQKLQIESDVDHETHKRNGREINRSVKKSFGESIIAGFMSVARMRVHRLLVFWIQLVSTSFVLSVIGGELVAIGLVLGMLGVFPLSITISRLVNRNVVLSLLIGGVVIGVLLGASAYAVRDWGVSAGILYGGFYGATLTRHFSQESEETSLAWAIANTVVVLIVLFTLYCSSFLSCFQLTTNDIGRGLKAPVIAIVLGLVFSPLVDPFRRLVDSAIDGLLNSR